MRQALRGSQLRAVPRGRVPLIAGAGQAVAIPKTIPAPYKGWDASSPLDDMDPAAAIVLDNFFPEPSYVRLRGGHTEHASGLGSDPVESVMSYHGPGGTEKLFGACGTSLFDATATGAVGAAALTGLGNARFQHCQQTTSGGNFLIIANGATAMRSFDGSSWASPSITGITVADVIHLNVHQHRLWMVLKNSTKGAYLAADAIAGAASTYDFGPLMSLGGYLNATATWTMDSGWGPDDFFAAITSKGQVIVYAGTDPSDANNWALKGVYNIGVPIGRRCFTKVGGDLAVVTVDGVVPLSKAIVLDRGVVRKASITGNIQRAMNEAARDTRDTFGWQLVSYPLGTAAILNVPQRGGTSSHQYVMNTLTGAWCRYTGQNAVAWEMFQDQPYFGGVAGSIFQADESGRDDGNLIAADLKTAFNYFGQRGANKSFRMLRALMTSDGQVVPTLRLNTDFSDESPATVASVYTASGAKWGTFDWGDGTLWAGGLVTLKDWIDAPGDGTCAAVRMKVAAANSNAASKIDLRINGFDIRYEPARGQL